MTKKTKVLDVLKELPPSRLKNRPFQRLTEEQQQDWDAIVSAIKDGELDHLGLVDIKKVVCDSFGIMVCMSTFRRQLGEAGIDKYLT
jgi:hypothetical protein